MISPNIFKFCKGDISKIENYEKAINSEELWDCHHRLEITLRKTRKELEEMDLYYNRPASELIFLTHEEHAKIHGLSGVRHVVFSEESRKRLSEKRKGQYVGEKNPFYGRRHSEETRKKLSEAAKRQFLEKGHPMKGKKMSEESRRRLSEAHKKKKVE